MVHRDLKPENVLIGFDGIARISDFGLASKLTELGSGNVVKLASAKESLTRTQLTQGAAGTPLYMPPEQWNRDSLDERADIYALGCILYEMVTGFFAARGTTRAELEEVHVNGRIKLLLPLYPEI